MLHASRIIVSHKGFNVNIYLFLFTRFCIVYIVYFILNCRQKLLYLFNGLNLFKLKEFVTTDTELNAIAPPAIIGFSNPRAAIGMPTML